MNRITGRASLWRAAFCGLMLLTGCASERLYSSGRRGLLDSNSWSGALARRSGPGWHESRSFDQYVTDARNSPNDDWSPEAKRKLASTANRWRWPLAKISCTSPFGRRNSNYHEGIDLAASVGTPVYAVSDGKVLFSGSRIQGYGKMVIIKHASGYLTLYAHLSKTYVRRGQKVHQGETVALTGASGHVSGPHLHFEIRRGVVAYDPALFLPQPHGAVRSHKVRPAILASSRRSAR